MKVRAQNMLIFFIATNEIFKGSQASKKMISYFKRSKKPETSTTSSSNITEILKSTHSNENLTYYLNNTTEPQTSTASTFNTTAGATGQNSSICQLDPDKGRCRASLDYWYFNSSTSTCSLFSYGGCGGNENRFYNCTECMKKCNDRPNITDICKTLEEEAYKDYAWEMETSPPDTTEYQTVYYKYSEDEQ
ncbi:tissue factor pathway inhibitor-like isoform X1 [Dermacentor variabilis]|uniref:tissue factor pathway inhibitor-like isoform X1 n=1 Tax=Dermacentor variabilis TaxID=34621 RepID=UPI003F5BE77C